MLMHSERSVYVSLMFGNDIIVLDPQRRRSALHANGCCVVLHVSCLRGTKDTSLFCRRLL